MKFKFNKMQLLMMIIMGIVFIAMIYILTPKSVPVVEPKIDHLMEAKNKASNPVDFEALKQMNEDVYAYIYSKGAGLDYPILQHPTDNSYYLNYMMNHVNAYPASIYTEKENTKDFQDSNTLIYGHNDTISNSMFNGITKFLEKEFFDQNRNVYIYTPTEILVYEVFAAYHYDDRHLLYAFNFQDSSVYENYIKDVLAREEETILKDVSITNEDDIITLSTCDFENIGRILVQAILKERIDCAYGTEVEISSTLLDAKELTD